MNELQPGKGQSGRKLYGCKLQHQIREKHIMFLEIFLQKTELKIRLM